MRQALEMALEALEKIAMVNAMDYEYQRWAKEHLATIKETLAQPEQEPVACIGYWNQKTGAYYKPDQISAAHKKLIDDGILRRCYTTPPQRKPLTDGQIWDLHIKMSVALDCKLSDLIEMTRAIEAAHNIKE
jgi:hypothetical protein